MNIDDTNLKEIKEWVDEEGYLDNVYDPITENTFYWLIARIEKHEKLLNNIFDVLDNYLGDSDPNLEDDITDEKLKIEEPLVWCCIQIRKALEEK